MSDSGAMSALRRNRDFVLLQAGQLLSSAGALDGKSLTCDPGIRDDMRVVAAAYRDEAVVVDGPLITARGNDELPEFCQQLVAALGIGAR